MQNIIGEFDGLVNKVVDPQAKGLKVPPFIRLDPSFFSFWWLATFVMNIRKGPKNFIKGQIKL